MGKLAGPVQSREIGAISFSFNVVGGRINVLIPNADFGAISLPLAVNCQYLDLEYWNCRRNAVETEINCLMDAQGRLDTCVRAAIRTAAAGVIVCLIAGGITLATKGAAVKWLIGACGGALVLGAGAYTAIKSCQDSYRQETHECRDDFDTAVTICCNEAELRAAQGG